MSVKVGGNVRSRKRNNGEMKGDTKQIIVKELRS